MDFLRLADFTQIPNALKGGVVAIGNFDGVHYGHCAVLERALKLAKANNLPALVLTFEPHPRTVFKPDAPVYRLTPAPLKAEILKELGFDAVVEQTFSRGFANHSAEDFVRDVLVGGFGVKDVVTGFDFHFGKGREGGPAFLMEAGALHGFGFTLVDALRDEGSEVVSSSRIRALLAAGDMAAAAALLGYRFRVTSEVVHGKKLGRTLGYPTANMALPQETELAHGIYAVRFRRQNGELYDGVASFGRRPTVTENGDALLETYLFNFDGDLYGEVATVTVFERLRGEQKFDGLDALVTQMNQDSANAKLVLAKALPVSDLDVKLNFQPTNG